MKSYKVRPKSSDPHVFLNYEGKGISEPYQRLLLQQARSKVREVLEKHFENEEAPALLHFA